MSQDSDGLRRRVVDSAWLRATYDAGEMEYLGAEAWADALTYAGLRPLLDQLNAEQELLNAQVTMLTARRDAYVAGFALLAVMGKADAADLNFDQSILYQPTVKAD